MAEARTSETAPRRLAACGRLLTLVTVVVTSGLVVMAGAPPASGSASPASPPSRSSTLVAPKTTYAQDATYFADIVEADPALFTYEQKHGSVARRALLTDGSAFCALLRRGGGIDVALVAEADGVRSTESQTKLPLSVTTFNTIEAIALLTLCPSEQKLVPAAVRSKIRRLGTALAHRGGSSSARGRAPGR